MKKRGLSDVVTTVLIVLLTLVAIALIWVFIRSGVEKSGDQVQKNILFSSVRFSVVPGTLNTTNNDVVFVLQRDAGPGEINGLVIVLGDDMGNSVAVYKYNGTLVQELNRLGVSITRTEHNLPGNITDIYIYPNIIDKSQTNPIVTPQNPVTTIRAGSNRQNTGGSNNNGGNNNNNPPIQLSSCGSIGQAGRVYVLTQNLVGGG
ncbi:MAG: archaellin/type IV pilin N-terminal domain-containing protein, partial [Nanoarchaeota archaeon]